MHHAPQTLGGPTGNFPFLTPKNRANSPVASATFGNLIPQTGLLQFSFWTDAPVRFVNFGTSLLAPWIRLLPIATGQKPRAHRAAPRPTRLSGRG